MAKRAFKVFLIKPSHYDHDGYVIQWHRSSIPSNSLASVHGLLAECADNKVLGPDVDIEIDACDECNTVVRIDRMIRQIRAAGGGFVGLVGVQSNQFPRALDIGRQFRAAGIPVVIGGFHVSGCISMLPELPPDLKEALDLGITLFAGEAEGRMAGLLRDIDSGQLKPVYDYLNDLPDMSSAHVPDPAGPRGRTGLGQVHELRCRPRLSVPVQLLHHHQRAGTQIALSHARRRRGHHPRQRGAGRDAILHHRRQFRAQQELGADPRPHHRAARAEGLHDPPADPGGYAVPPHPRLHRQGAARRLRHRLYRPREHQPGIPDRAPRSARTRSGNTARCCRPGARPR